MSGTRSGSRSSGTRSSDTRSEGGRSARDEPASFDSLFAGFDASENDEPEVGRGARNSRKAEKPKKAKAAKPAKPTRAEKAAAKRRPAAKAAGPRRGASVPSAPQPVDVDLAFLAGVAGGGAPALDVARTAEAGVAAALAAGAAAASAAALRSDMAGSARDERAASVDQVRRAPSVDLGPAASAVVPPADTTAGFATAIAAAAGAAPSADPSAGPAAATLNLDSPMRRTDRATAPVSEGLRADVDGVSDLLAFGTTPESALPRAADASPTRRASQRPAPAARDAARTDVSSRRSAPRAAAPRPTARAVASGPTIRRSATRRMASLVAMSFAALLAVATTIPSLSLLTPADVQALALADSTGMSRDGQRMELNGDIVAQSMQREGYESQTIQEYAQAAGIRAEADFTNNPAGTIQWPFAVGVHIGDRFGYRDCAGCSSDHGGQDFNPGYGAEIQAIADGTVAVSTDSGGSLGVVMMIDHIIDGEVVTSVYAHMIEGSRRFEVGDTVHVADVIGQTGNTGMSTGPHLHFEIRLGGVNGTKVDPLEWLYANTN